MKVELVEITRPFQGFFQAANDLLEAARPMHTVIQEHRARFESSGVLVQLDQDLWRREKSLSIGAFMLQYAGLESLVNCTYHDFRQRDVQELPSDTFDAIPPKKRKKLMRKGFQNWQLDTRVYAIVPICSDDSDHQPVAFNINSNKWLKFREIVQIRNSFIHANSHRRKMRGVRVGPKRWEATDVFPENLWPMTRISRVHHIFNFESALTAYGCISWVVERLCEALPDRLNDSYMNRQTAEVSKLR